MAGKGIYVATHKDNSIYYRVSINRNGKHISLGSFDTKKEAISCYKEAELILSDPSIKPDDYNDKYNISFNKFVVLVNFRDTGIYFPNPIYLRNNYFEYYLSKECVLKFDRDDMFYYSKHKIMKRGSHLFVSEYGMQVNINERYNILPYSVLGKDYIFINNDLFDYRYSNIKIIKKYNGVKELIKGQKKTYISRIHINGYTKIGEYESEIEAAIAYNKAIDVLTKYKTHKFLQNNPDISAKEYAEIYSRIKISPKIKPLR